MLKHDRPGRHHVVVATVPAGQAGQCQGRSNPVGRRASRAELAEGVGAHRSRIPPAGFIGALGHISARGVALLLHASRTTAAC